MVKIAFWDNYICERGTSIALFDYAYYNIHILNNESIILYNKTISENDKDVIEKFKKKLNIYGVNDFKEVDQVLKDTNCDILYVIKYGNNDNKVSKIIKTVVHCVFECKEPHGDIYSSISPWVKGNNGKHPVVPHIVYLPDNNLNLRSKLGIPDSAIVFGRYGGYLTFNIEYIYNIVYEVALSRSDIYFLFVNTKPFCNSLPNIIHLDKIIDLNDKVTFINTCDAMLWGRSCGETFGLAIAEFSIKNKPIFATKENVSDICHAYLLKDKAYWYNENSLKDILLNFNKEEIAKKDWNAYRDYTPEKVMQMFKKVYIDPFSNYISGLYFNKISNWNLCSRYSIKFQPENIKENDLVFVNLDYFNDFVHKLNTSKPINKFRLITHNSDASFTDNHYNQIASFVNQVFAINNVSSKAITIPIGFRDSTLDTLLSTHTSLPKTILLYMNFQIYTNEKARNECYNTFEKYSWVTNEKLLKLDDYYKRLSESKYVLSPEGTGIDCHRIYEAIYLNSIPIIKSGLMDSYFKKLPVIIINNWTDITEDFLVNEYSKYYSNLQNWKLNNKDWLSPKFWLNNNIYNNLTLNEYNQPLFNRIIIDNGSVSQIGNLNTLWDGMYSKACINGSIVNYLKSYLTELHSKNINTLCIILQTDGNIQRKHIAEYIEQAKKENKTLIIGTLGQTIDSKESNLNYLYLPLDDHFFSNGVLNTFKQHWVKWEDRKSMALWRGGCSGFGNDSVRIRTVRTLINYTYADVKLNRYWYENKNIPHNYFADKVDLIDFFNNKIFLIIDGNILASNHMWGFATGCVPFLITNAECWFSEFLKPFVNYIPIKYDLSDLIEKIEWVRDNDELAEKISRNALEFVNDIFSADFQHAYLRVSINNIIQG
jgi:hypothetical protein